jgi:hypothetical protein
MMQRLGIEKLLRSIERWWRSNEEVEESFHVWIATDHGEREWRGAEK